MLSSVLAATGTIILGLSVLAATLYGLLWVDVKCSKLYGETNFPLGWPLLIFVVGPMGLGAFLLVGLVIGRELLGLVGW